MRPLAFTLTLVAATLIGACSSIWSRGFVQDEQGRVVGRASVRVTSAAGSGTVVDTATDEFGCFLLGKVPPKGERRFQLEVAAPGYEPVTFDFDLQTPILITTLAKTGTGARSDIHAATTEEQEDKWTPYCNPSFSGGQQLAP